MDAHRKTRLALLLQERFGGDRGALIAATGLSKGRIAQLLDVKNVGEPFGERAATNLAAKIGLKDERWFDRTTPVECGFLGVPKSDEATPTGRNPETVILQYNTGGKMGHGLILRDQPGVINAWHVSPEWLRQNVPAHTGVENLCIVTGFGPSMMPMFNPGDPLLIDRGVTRIEFDAVYFFRLGNEGFIKLVQRVPDGGAIRLRAKSKNPDYDPFWIDETMGFEVFGRVLRVWRGENA